MNDYKILDVWSQGMKVSRMIYKNTRLFPKEERFGLTNQIRRASISVVSNIAEGCGRRHKNDRLQFFYISRGSLYELECQLYIAKDLGYIGESAFELTKLNIQKAKMILNRFIKHNRNLNY